MRSIRRRATDAVLLLNLQVGQLEDELFERLGLRLRLWRRVGGEAPVECHEDGVERCLRAAGAAAGGDVLGLVAKECFQSPRVAPSSEMGMTRNAARSSFT